MRASRCCGSIRYGVSQKKIMYPFVFAALLLMGYYSHKIFEQSVSYSSVKNSVDYSSVKNSVEEDIIDFMNSDNVTGFSSDIVPNVVHFIHFDSSYLSFIEVVNIRAAYLHHVPEKIMIHCNCDSLSGKYWDMVKDIRVLELRFLEKPTHVFGKELTSVQHSSDVARIKVLMKYGGIFLDSDSYVVKPLDYYRKYELTLGWPPGEFIGIQVLIAHRNARFLKLWLSSYKYYSGDLWYYNGGELPTKMFLYPMPHLVHRVPCKLGVHNLVQMLYVISSNEWKDFDCIHLLVHHKSYLVEEDPIVEFNEENIKTYNKTFGEMARLVIYGTSDLITDKHETKLLSMNVAEQR